MSCRTAGSYGRALKAGLLVLLLTVCSILPAAAYTLTVLSGENGTTTTTWSAGSEMIDIDGGKGVYTIDAGTIVTMQFSPFDYQKVDKVLVNDADVTADLQESAISQCERSYSFTMNSDMTLNVTYRTIYPILSITSEGGGSISFSTSMVTGTVAANTSEDVVLANYEAGDQLTLTFTPSSDAYKLVAATVNGTNVMDDLTPDGAYYINNVTDDITVYGGFDISIKDGTVMTEVIDGIEWTYTVTDEANKVCHLGAVDSGMNSITAVPTTTEAESITIPSVINGYTVKGLAVEAFRDCSGLTGQLNIPSTVTFIGDMAFMGTHFSGPLTLPEGLNDLCSYSFYNLYNLTGDLVIPESLTVLPADAFFNCMGFTSLTLPSTVTKIWTGCFGRMLGLTQITCLATTPPELSKDDVFTTYDVPLFVPAESVDAYKAAQYWSNFTNIYAIGTELNHTLTVASSGGGKIVGAIKNLTGEIYSEFESNPDSDDPVEFPVTVPVGYSVEMTLTPKTGYYLNEVTKNGSENLTSQVVDNKLTLTDINEDMKVSAVFERITLLLQLASTTSHGTVSWEVNDVSGTGITYGVVDNSVEDIPVPYGSTVTLTFNYDHTQYGLSQLTRNGVSVLADVLDDAYIISNYTANDTIVVNYTEMAAEAYAALGDGNTVLTFYYDKQKTARGGMSVGPFASEADNPWYTYSSSITTVVFDESFAGYTTLTSTANWFYDCENLTTVTGISNLKTDNVTDMQFMFHGCSSLPAIDLSTFNTANVQSMQGLFFRCESLTSLDLSTFNTDNVTDMGAMFSRCISLASVNVSSFNTSKVTDMRLMFNQCSSLTSVDLSTFNTSLVTDMGYMFSNCSNLQTIYVGDGWSTASVADGSSTFNSCTALIGGMGTVYDADHIDAAYAHIDGGAANPGYLTPQGGYVEAPTFIWNGDNLTMTTGTEGATIYYTIVDNSATVPPTAVEYTSPVNVTSDVLITAYAEKEGMASSPSTVLEYPYTAWKALTDAIAEAQTVSSQAATNDNVTDTQRTELAEMITLSQGMYEARVDSAAAINQQTTNLTTLTATIQQLVNAEAEPYAVLSNENTVVTFYYDKKKQERGGFDINNVDVGVSPYGTATTAVFDASFDAYRPTSTAYWFLNCNLLTTITGMEYLHTDDVTDMKFMFNSCSGLTSLDLSSFNTANVTDMSNMFSSCSGLTSLYVSSFNTSNVTDMRYMFNGCSGLTSLDLSSFNTSNVTYMYNMFNGCSSLTSLDLSSFNTANVMYMQEMFYDCHSLTSLDLSSFNTANVTDMRGMFYNCSSLTTLDVSSFSTANVTDMHTMFQSCSGLTSLDLSSFNTANVTTMYFMLANCTSLTTIYAGEGWSTGNVTQSGGMFYDCTALVGGKGTVYDADHIDAAYAHVDGGTANPGYFTDKNVSAAYAVLSDGGTVVTFYYDNMMGTRGGIDINNTETFNSPYGSATTAVFDASFDAYRPTSTAYWFQNCNLLTAITGIEYLHTDDVTSMISMFEGCSGLTSLDLSNFNTANVTDMSGMFRDCSGLTSLDLSSFNTANVTDMNTMFAFCNGLTTLNVSNFNTANVTDMQYMFAVCNSLTSLDLSSFNTEKVTSMTSMFDNCSSLTSLNLSGFNTASVTGMNYMFSSCSSLTSLDLSSFNTANVTDMSGMLKGCAGLTTLDLSSFNTANVTNMSEMFDDCSGLTTIYAGEGWSTENVTESGDMFDNCTALVGGMGTVYDDFQNNANYAHIDGGTENPGYFSDINAPTTYTVTVDVFGGGSVTAGGETITEYTDFNREVSVDAGGSLLLTFTPADSHRLATVVLDGTDVTSQVIADSTGVSYYTLTSIYDDHTVTATFVNDTIDVVGNTDFSSAWWTAFSSNYEIPADHTLHMQFTNHSDKVNNWDNWVLMCTADSTRTPEYFALRADSYGWGDYYNGDGLSSNWTDWDAFREGMDGALVDLTVRRWGSEVTVTTVAKAADDTEYVQTLTTTIDPAADQSINVFLTVENAYLEIYKNSITLTPSEAPAIPEAYAVLSTDGTVVTFYYDRQKTERGGIDINNTDSTAPYATATIAVFDSSFDAYRPTSTANWFMGCSSLTTITDIGYLHTDDVTSMQDMFYDCSGLTSLDLSNFNTANVTNMMSMFAGCSALTSLDLSSFNTANVKYMGYMFRDCSNLTSLDLSNFNTGNVTEMQRMFYNCSSLPSLDVTNFNTGNVTDMSFMFYGCSGLTSLDVTNFNTANVTAMDWMFAGCSGLTSLDVTNFNTANVTNMSEMFAGCSGLTSLDVTNFNTANVTNMYYMFYGCSGLTSLDLSSFNTANVTEMDWMFGGCSSLTTIYAGEGWSTDNLIDGGGSMFVECYALVGGMGTVLSNVSASYAHIDGGTENPGYFTDKNASVAYAVLSSDSTVVTFYYDNMRAERGGININNTPINGTSTSPYGTAKTAVFDASFDAYRPTSTAYWFRKCELLTTITGIECLHTDNVTDMSHMFDGCSALTNLDVSGFNTTNVTDMNFMFSYCSALTSIDVSNFNTANVTNMERLFFACGLTSLDVTNFNTGNVTNMVEMFWGCSNLTSLDLSNFNTANVTDMSYMFTACRNMTTIYVGEGWSTENVTASDFMFYDCTALVGGMGTAFDADHIDAAYAHIDGGTANPGYFSRLLSKGDANGDGEVNIADAVATVTNILGEPATGNFYRSMADMNGDDEIDIFDVTLIVNAALAANTGGSRYMAGPSNIDRIAAEDVRLTAKADRLYLDIDRTEKFTAFQFDVTLPKGTELLGVKLGSAITDHQLTFVKRGDGQYRVVGLSMSNQVIDAASSRLIQLQLSDPTADRNVQVSNVLFVNPQAKDATGIGQRPTVSDTQDGGYYDMNGRYMGTDKQQLSKGMYIKNHKKVIIK